MAGQGSFTFTNGNVANFAGDAFGLNGGCPTIRDYDGARNAGTAVITHRYTSGTATGTGAIIMNTNNVLNWNTIWLGFGWFDIRNAFNASPSSGTGTMTRGYNQSAAWNGLGESGRRVPSGVHFYQLVTDELTFTKKMVMLKELRWSRQRGAPPGAPRLAALQISPRRAQRVDGRLRRNTGPARSDRPLSMPRRCSNLEASATPASAPLRAFISLQG